jgi:hypothetical protein
LTDQPIGLPRFAVLEGSGVSTLNALLQLHSGEQSSATIPLRNMEGDFEFHVTIVEVHIEHDPDEGVFFFDGRLDDGRVITGHVRSKADETLSVGFANIKM